MAKKSQAKLVGMDWGIKKIWISNIFIILLLHISTSWEIISNFIAPTSDASCLHGVGDMPSVVGGYSFMKKKTYTKIVGKWTFVKNTPDLSPTSHWKKVSGYTHYIASLYGQIYSLVPKRNKMLRQNTCGIYRMLDLCENSIRKMQLVHRAVGKTWIPNVYGKPFINHKDVDPTNNWVYNIHWVTHAENQQWALLYGNRKRGGGIINARPVVRLTLAGEFISKHNSIADAEKETGVNRGAISTSCSNKYPKAWRHNFMFLEEYQKLNTNG